MRFKGENEANGDYVFIKVKFTHRIDSFTRGTSLEFIGHYLLTDSLRFMMEVVESRLFFESLLDD